MASPIEPNDDPHRAVARNLLFGLLAFQNGFIDREALLGAFNAWVDDRSRPLAQLLLDRGALDAPRRALLEALVREHLKIHDDDPEKSLASLSSVEPVMSDLSQIPAEDVRAGLSAIGRDRRHSEATGDHASSHRRAGERFRILKLHAKGGLGQVYEAHDKELGRKVALKEILPEKADRSDLRARFVLEAEINGGLQHPGIVPVYSLGAYDDGKPFYAMRFVEGASLRDTVADYHKAHPRPDLTTKDFRDLLNRFLDVCNAISFAHSRGVLHRDLKPHNVMIGNYGEALLIDWGLAKATGQHSPASEGGQEEPTLVPPSGSDVQPTFGAIGTPAYMSPEQAAGKVDQLGPATDVYGLGAILYHLLTGQAPVRGREGEDVLPRVIRGEIAPPRSLNPRAPVALEAICLKALALRPEDRYPTARALADDLAHWMADEPVSARRDPLLARVGRWTRKHRVASAAAAATLVVGLAASLYGFQRERSYATNLDHQRQRAENNEQSAIDAVKRFHDVISQEPLLKDTKDLDELRKRILREPLTFYRALRDRLQADRDTRPESLSRLATANFELGVLSSEIGDELDAITSFRESQSILQALADTQPEVDKHRSDLAASQNNLGYLLRATGQLGAARKAHEAALALRQALTDAHPNATEYKSGLAASHNNLGAVLNDIDQLVAARRAFEAALAIRQALADAHPSSTRYRSDLATSHHDLGAFLSEIGQADAALKAHEAALAIHQALADAHPDVTRYRSDLATSHNDLGLILSATGQAGAARKAFENALAMRQALADAHPSSTRYRSDLATSHNNLGAFLSKTGQADAAREAHNTALAIHQALVDAHPDVTQHQIGLAVGYNNLGASLSATGQIDAARKAHEAALAMQQKLADAQPDVTRHRSDLAASHYRLGNFLRGVGQLGAARKAHEAALAIRRSLADAQPDVTRHRSDLAASHNDLGLILSAIGQADAARKAFEDAVTIHQALADAHPDVTRYQISLAVGYNNLGASRSATGQFDAAREAHEAALAIQQRLADAQPDVTRYRSDLATSHNNLGLLLRATGQTDAARKAHEAALAIHQALADAHPDETAYKSGLAASHYDLGSSLKASGQADAARKTYEAALLIREQLARNYPESPDHAFEMGRLLQGIAVIDLEARQYEEGRLGIQQAIVWQKKALLLNPSNPTYRRFMADYLTLLNRAFQVLGRAEEAAAAQHELDELRANDPLYAALDARLATVLKGDPPKHNAERLVLAKRAYDTRRHAAAAKLWGEALETNLKLGDDRQAQHRYNASCAAALAASGETKDDPPPDDDARAEFRQKALGWLRAELTAWTALIENGPTQARPFVVQTLQHWQGDTDLAGVRDPDALAKLPDDERSAWRSLWDDVASLLEKSGNAP